MSSEAIFPLVSVVLPVYNAESYIKRCVDSILSQDYPNIEVIAIDDGSKDGSLRVLQELSEVYPGKLVFESQENAGVAVTRNRAIVRARGEYLMFADNDDYYEPGSIRMLVDAAVRSNAQVVCAGFRRPDEQGAIVAQTSLDPSDSWAPYAVSAAWAKLFDSSFVKSNGLEFLSTNIGEDIFFTLPAMELAERIEVIPEIVYNWYYNDSSVSNTSHKHSKGLEFEYTLQKVLERLHVNDRQPSDLASYYLVRLIVWFLLYTCKGDSWQEVCANERRYRDWCDGKLRAWTKNPYSRFVKPKSDALKNRVSVALFTRYRVAFLLLVRAYRRFG